MRSLLVASLLAAFCGPALAQRPLTDAQIASAFATADTDKSGTVGLAEAKKFGITADNFRKADRSRRAELTKTEFAAAIGYQFGWANANRNDGLDWKQASMAGVKSKQVFDAADPDHSGKLDLGEYLAALTAQAK